MEMLRQRLREILNQAPKLLSIKVLGASRLSILHKLLESGRESSVLLDIPFHDTFDSGNLLYAWEEELFLLVMVVLHRFTPALAVCEEVFDSGEVFPRDIGRLEVD